MLPIGNRKLKKKYNLYNILSDYKQFSIVLILDKSPIFKKVHLKKVKVSKIPELCFRRKKIVQITKSLLLHHIRSITNANKS